MKEMVKQLADFVTGSSWDDLSHDARNALKIRVLDALGCALGALSGPPIRLIREQIEDFGGRERCTMIGGRRTSPDRAAFYNSALVRYLDFNDSYLAKGETCHPSDNLGAVLAAVEYANGSGRDLLTALAVAYQVQCRLSDEAPVRHKGFDHTTQGSYAVAAGVAKGLGLDEERTANALAISGTALNALRVTRTGHLSNWKGLAYPHTCFAATHAAFLAMRGVTGPMEVFEGNKGFMEAIAGSFTIDWSRENLERVTHTIVKRYNAEIHSQSATEGALELKTQYEIDPATIERIELEIFDVAFNIIGGGEEGGKKDVRTKEEADHSLPYIVAVALLDGNVMPPQYHPERINRPDVQELLRKIDVTPRQDFSDRFPAEMPCRLVMHLSDGRTLERVKSDYQGFFSNPQPWNGAVEKFRQVTAPFLDAGLQREIIAAVAELPGIEVHDLIRLLGKV